MIYEIFRLIGVFTGYPAQLIFFKRRTFYEDKNERPDFKHGGKLIIANHYNILDYVLSCFIVCPRKLYVIASEDPFKSKIVTFGMKFFGAIQANRITKDMRFMDQGAEVIRNGNLLQIFPEGRNTPDGKIHSFKQSYIVIAHRAKCKIVPIVTDGNYGLFKRVNVMIGKEIDLAPFISSDKHTPTREELSAANAYIHAKMLSLREELEQRKEGKNK